MKTLLLLVLAGAGLASVGCSHPRLVRGITSRNDEVKFLYVEGGDTGVIKCKMGADGALSECHSMSVNLEE